jgi:DNA-binding transcriptional MerR regulator
MKNRETKTKAGFVTISEACSLLEINRQTLYHLRITNLLVAEPTTNGKVYFKLTAVQALQQLMNEHRTEL